MEELQILASGFLYIAIICLSKNAELNKCFIMEVNFEVKIDFLTYLYSSSSQIHKRFHRSLVDLAQLVSEIIFLITGDFKVRNTQLWKYSIRCKQKTI